MFAAVAEAVQVAHYMRGVQIDAHRNTGTLDSSSPCGLGAPSHRRSVDVQRVTHRPVAGHSPRIVLVGEGAELVELFVPSGSGPSVIGHVDLE